MTDTGAQFRMAEQAAGGMNAPTAGSPAEQQFMDQYGYQAAFVESVPELRAVLQKAIFAPLAAGQKPWTPQAIHAALIATNYYRQHGDAWFNAENMKANYNALASSGKDVSQTPWAVALATAQDKIRKDAVQRGYQIPDGDVAALADTALHQSGGNPNGIDLSLVQNLYTAKGKLSGGGDAQSNTDALKQYASAMGVPHDDAWYQSAANSITGGTTDLTFWKTQLTAAAKSQFPSFAQQIDAGQTVDSIASPYKQHMASILEVDPNAVSLSDPMIQQGLNSKDAKGNLSPMSLWQFDQSLRNDPRWANTKNARDSIDSASRNVLQDFGLAW